MQTCKSVLEAQSVPNVVSIWAGPPVIAYQIGDTIPTEHLGLPDPKEAMWDAIKTERDRRKEAGGYMVSVSGVSKWFHSDTFSRTQQIGLVMMGVNIPAGLQWKTMDGSFVTMTQALANAIFAAGAAQDQATFAQAETHHAAMLASADPASYDFSGGWPAIYGG
jgi:hypothetical protein